MIKFMTSPAIFPVGFASNGSVAEWDWIFVVIFTRLLLSMRLLDSKHACEISLAIFNARDGSFNGNFAQEFVGIDHKSIVMVIFNGYNWFYSQQSALLWNIHFTWGGIWFYLCMLTYKLPPVVQAVITRKRNDYYLTTRCLLIIHKIGVTVHSRNETGGINWLHETFVSLAPFSDWILSVYKSYQCC